MEFNIERIMILLQRKYGAIQEILRLTKELEEIVNRNDGISAAMILQLRGDEMVKAEQCMEELWQMGESSKEAYDKLQVLMTSDLEQAVGATKEEKKIYEIRRRTRTVLDQAQAIDERLHRRLAGDKSFYKTGKLVSAI